MELVLSWLAANWGTILIITTVLASIINIITPHFENQPGVKKVLLIILDILSLTQSKGSVGLVKLPGLLSKKAEEE